MALMAEVTQAIDEIRSAYPDVDVAVREDGQGGAFVVVDPVELGELYDQAETWIGFQITFQYPYSDVYPHFVRGDLARHDGATLGDGTSAATWEGRPALQLSRRSNQLDPTTDTAVLKLLKVLDWLRGRR
jgi:hypothetical protein